jgi:hypothetical protein
MHYLLLKCTVYGTEIYDKIVHEKNKYDKKWQSKDDFEGRQQQKIRKMKSDKAMRFRNKINLRKSQKGLVKLNAKKT